MVNGDIREESGWFDWAYKGVDHSFPGNGGLECRDFLSIPQRCVESVAACVIAVFAVTYAWPRLKLPEACPCIHHHKHETLGKRILLLLMCLTFGIELGFKFATRQMIWIGNPCHIATMVQIFILAAPPSRIVTAAFRLHLHMLTGAPIAILFPVINTRLLPFETGVYFLQHILMLVIPFYLMHIGDPFIPEPLGDFSWALTSLGFLFVYHFVPLQLLAYVSQVNLNNMLCPAVSDPFHGQFYRVCAIGHQIVLILILGKVFVIIARAFRILPCETPPDVDHVCSCLSSVNRESSPPRCAAMDDATDGDSSFAGDTCTLSNGHKVSRNNVHSRLCHCGGDCGSSCFNVYSHNISKADSREFITSCYDPVTFSTQLIINGQLVKGIKNDEHCCRRRVLNISSHEQGSSDSSGAGRNCQHSSCFLTNSQFSNSEKENGVNKTLVASNLEKSPNGHAKPH